MGQQVVKSKRLLVLKYTFQYIQNFRVPKMTFCDIFAKIKPCAPATRLYSLRKKSTFSITFLAAYFLFFDPKKGSGALFQGNVERVPNNLISKANEFLKTYMYELYKPTI